MRNRTSLTTVLLGWLAVCGIWAQTSQLIDDRYLEDQFYIGLGINFLLDRPTDVVQRSLSYSLQTGFIKDIPLSARRNVGLGLGLGYAVNSYYTNIKATQVGDAITYEVVSTDDIVRS